MNLSPHPKLHSEAFHQKRFPENLPPVWQRLLSPEKDKIYFQQLTEFLKTEYSSGTQIYPPRDQMLRALQFVDYSQIRVVLLGQDPYHGPDQAMGLSFAVPNSLQPKPPSLQNIFKELKTDYKLQWNGQDSELTGWAQQGVLLLNTVLSVRKAQAFSHRNKGWETFTDRIIELLNLREEPVIFFLWGSAAHKKQALITNKQHFVLKTVHPSPLSAHRGFFGSGHFSKANQILTDQLSQPAINWAQINAI